MMILAVSRRLPQLLELQRERTWQPLEGAELRDVTVGIVGLGSIGRAVGALATAFGCRVVRSAAAPDRRRGADAGRATTDAAARRDACSIGSADPRRCPSSSAESDFIVLAAPLTPETEDMINAETLAMVKPGRVAHQRRARPARSTSGRCSARCATGRSAARCSTRSATSRCRRCRRSTTCPNVIVTPHTAWSSGRVLDRSVELFCDNLRRFAAGEPLLNVVDPTAGY